MKRGRKTTGDLQVLVGGGTRMPPPPPAELTDAQAAVWRDVVSSLPGDWLDRGCHPILVEYCRHTCRARLLERQIRQFEVEWVGVEGGLERLEKLLAMSERELRGVLACARALRLTPQAKMHPRTAGRRLFDFPGAGPRPWE